ncbi:hypothetical protein Msil_1731 [Methylocella silvestris BL2]|uniref:Tox-MPTase3 domain-containing protein n=1 Tax=Methylocella silvestris (strain DSM 15510 / CIP 108128 / LMG 27833 / NCIMB 13906 / BL2) TaxID=395965 RepID=B8EKD7_METSB|nr:hypothetical protein [Methylocella silvestris]ACK50677.1 hypothetical protein Msil_1731 [Methylocella silvestris BL2]
MIFEQFESGDAGPTASSADHASKFPCCGQYLKYWLSPQTMKAKTPDRWKIFVKWCGNNEVWATEACAWGKGPLVQINSAKVGHAMGRTTGDDNGQVVCFIHGKVANKYEQGNGWIIWESTVLHELIHWTRWKQKLSDPTDDAGNAIEVGKAFEAEAYGADVTLQTPWRAGP